MSVSSIYAFLVRGGVSIWNGGAATRSAFLAGVVVVIAFAYLLYLLVVISWHAFRRVRLPDTFLISGLSTAQWISLSIMYLDSTKDALSNMRSGEQVAVDTTGIVKKTLRGKLQRRTVLAKNEIDLSARAFEKITGEPWVDGMERVPIKLIVRPGYSLWNHPDDAIRISTRVTFWVTLINFILSFLMGGFFWWLPH